MLWAQCWTYFVHAGTDVHVYEGLLENWKVLSVFVLVRIINVSKQKVWKRVRPIIVNMGLLLDWFADMRTEGFLGSQIHRL